MPDTRILHLCFQRNYAFNFSPESGVNFNPSIRISTGTFFVAFATEDQPDYSEDGWMRMRVAYSSDDFCDCYYEGESGDHAWDSCPRWRAGDVTQDGLRPFCGSQSEADRVWRWLDGPYNFFNHGQNLDMDPGPRLEPTPVVGPAPEPEPEPEPTVSLFLRQMRGVI